MEYCVALAVIAIPAAAAFHIRMHEANIRKSFHFLQSRLRTNSTPKVKAPSFMDNTQRQLRVEEELQKMRVHLFHTRAKYAVHFSFLLVLTTALSFVYDPSWKAISSLVFWALVYGYFAVFHSLNLVEVPGGWRCSEAWVLFAHLFLVLTHWYWTAIEWSDPATFSAALIPNERFQAVSLTLICSNMLDSRYTVPWCYFHAALQFCKSWQRFGLAECLSTSVLCQEAGVQFLTIMPIIAVEKLVRLKIEAVLESQDESSMVSGFRRVLRGVCDGDMLFDHSFKVVDDGSSLDRLLGRPQGTTTGTNLLHLFNPEDCKRFVGFIRQSEESSEGSMPGGCRVTVTSRQGPIALDLFHVPIRGQGFKKGCNHLLAIKQDADQALPDAPAETQGIPTCFKELSAQNARGSRSVASSSSWKSGHRELTMYYSNLQEVTLLLSSHSEMWDVGELHIKFQRHKSIDLGMPTLRNFTRPTDWERISEKIRHVIEKPTAQKTGFQHPVWFRMPGESNKYLSARRVSVGRVKETAEGDPVLLWMNLLDFDFSQAPIAALKEVDEN